MSKEKGQKEKVVGVFTKISADQIDVVQYEFINEWSVLGVNNKGSYWAL